MFMKIKIIKFKKSPIWSGFYALIILAFSCQVNKPKETDILKTISSKQDTAVFHDMDDFPKYISNCKDSFESEVKTLNLQYILWGCPCPNWITRTDYIKFQNNKMIDHCIKIYPATNDSNLMFIADPEHFNFGTDLLQVTGQYCKEANPPRKATNGKLDDTNYVRVFKYFNMKILRNVIKE